MDELPALRHIWDEVFGTGGGIFFSHCCDPKMCVVVTQDNKPVSMGHLLPAGNFTYGETKIPCAMIFAVATLNKYRGKGYAGDVVDGLIQLAREKSYGAVILRPADDWLFEYYGGRSGFSEFFYINEQKYSIDSLTNKCSNKVNLKEILPDEYFILRNEFLIKRPHIESTPHAIAYQSLLCKEYGGGLYRAALGSESSVYAIAAVEKDIGNKVIIKELLVRSGETDVLSAVAALFPASEYIVRTPSDQAISSRFGMLSPLSEAANNLFNDVQIKKTAPWYGLAFD